MMVDWDRKESMTDGRLAKICFPSRDGRFRITARKLLPLDKQLDYLVEDLETGTRTYCKTMAEAVAAVEEMEEKE